MSYIDQNDYLYNPQSTIGILLIHGFSSSTYETKFLAKYLSKFNFHVVTYNLPGHGTDIDDCNNTKYTEWLDFTKKKLAELASTSKKIFIIGHSMGGSITLQLASFFPVDGIIIGATVLKFKRKFETYFLVPLFNKIQYKINKKKMFSKEHLLKNSFGYTEYPLVALNEFRKMNRGIIKNLHKVTCPTLIIHSNSDITSSKENVDLIYNSIASTDIKKVIVEDSSHHLFVDEKDQKIIYEEILNFLTKHTKQE